MDRILALVIILLIPHLSYAGSSTVVYPKWNGVTTVKIPSTGQTVKAAGAGAAYDQAHNVFSFSGAAGISAVLPHMANAVGDAITARAPVIQSLAKQVGVTALKTSGSAAMAFIALWALEKGLSQDINGQWIKNVSGNAPPGFTENCGDGYSCYPLITVYSACYSDQSCGGQYQTIDEACALSNGHPNYVGAIACPQSGKSYKPVQGCPHGGFVYAGQCYMDSIPQEFYGSTHPAQESDFNDLIANGRDLTPAEMQEMIAAGYAIPIGEPETKIANSPLKAPLIDYDVVLDVNGNPNFIPKDLANLHTDPVTGEKTMPMVSIEPAPNGGVRLSPYEVPYTAQGVPATDAQGNPLPVQQSNPDPCELNPDRAGCAQLGTLDDATPAPTQTPVSITPEAAWGGAGQCPQDVVLNVMGQSIPFKFSGACQFFQLMNPVVLAAAWVSALFIFIGGVRTES